jgi:hypothetical protein
VSRPRRLLAVAVVALAAATGAVVAWAARDDGVPLPRPLAEALTRALDPRVGAGVRMRFAVHNELLPAGSVGPPLAGLLDAGAEGHAAVAPDGRFRVVLDTAAGAFEVAFDGRRLRLWSPLLPAVYETALAPGSLRTGAPPGPAEVRAALRQLGRVAALSAARPTTVAGRPAYVLRIDPRDDGGLLGAVEVAWDADRGLPLRGAVYAQGEDAPALEVEATDVELGPVPAADLALGAPTGTPAIPLDDGPDAARSGAGRTGRTGRTGATGGAGGDAAPVPPRRVAGLQRRLLRRGLGGAAGTLAVYGGGLGTVLVLQAPADVGTGAGALGLPEVNIDGATGVELATALGTGLLVSRGGVTSVVAGLVPPLAAENVARGLLRAAS